MRFFHTSPLRHPSVNCDLIILYDVIINIYKCTAVIRRNQIHKNRTVFQEKHQEKHNKTLEMGAPASSRRSADPHRERSIPLLLPPSRGSRHGVAETKCALIGGTIREAYWSDVSTFSFLFLFCSFRRMEGEEGAQRVA